MQLRRGEKRSTVGQRQPGRETTWNEDSTIATATKCQISGYSTLRGGVQVTIVQWLDSRQYCIKTLTTQARCNGSRSFVKSIWLSYPYATQVVGERTPFDRADTGWKTRLNQRERARDWVRGNEDDGELNSSGDGGSDGSSGQRRSRQPQSPGRTRQNADLGCFLVGPVEDVGSAQPR